MCALKTENQKLKSETDPWGRTGGGSENKTKSFTLSVRRKTPGKK